MLGKSVVLLYSCEIIYANEIQLSLLIFSPASSFPNTFVFVTLTVDVLEYSLLLLKQYPLSKQNNSGFVLKSLNVFASTLLEI